MTCFLFLCQCLAACTFRVWLVVACGLGNLRPVVVSCTLSTPPAIVVMVRLPNDNSSERTIFFHSWVLLLYLLLQMIFHLLLISACALVYVIDLLVGNRASLCLCLIFENCRQFIEGGAGGCSCRSVVFIPCNRAEVRWVRFYLRLFSWECVFEVLSRR